MDIIKMKEFLKQNMLYIIGGVLGAIGGYLYYHFIGCTTGTCPITSSPYLSILFGAIIGSLLLSMFKKEKKKEN